MPKFKGTPGPWVLMRSGNGYPYQIEDRHGKGITKWGGISAPMSTSSEHNALLIAAAPDLLDALIDALSCMERTVEYYDPAIDKSRAAIAKALGQ